MRDRKQQDHALRVCRNALEYSLARPARDHAGQIEALRAAVANTAAAMSLPSLGLLIWPGGFPLSTIKANLGASPNRFRVVRDDVARDWGRLYAAPPETRVFDPYPQFHSSRDVDFIVRARRFENVICGLNCCRDAIGDLLTAEARA